MTHEYDDRRDAIQRARETLRRLDDADRRRRFEEQQRGPVDDLDCVEPMPVADWRGCKTTTEMTSKQFSKWIDDGKPALTAPVVMVPKSKVADIIRSAVDQERANTQASLEAFAEIMGEEVAAIETRLRADFNVELAELRAQLHELRGERSAGDILDLPDWRSHHVEH
jgi:hypothetical protein